MDFGTWESAALGLGDNRANGGENVYMGGVVKALLQSCPFLAALVIPAAVLIRGVEDRGQLSLLFLVSAVFPVFYSYFAWWGGGALNSRYFLPLLPLTSILVAFAWHEITHGLSRRWVLPRLMTAAVTATVFLVLMVLSETAEDEDYSLVVQEIMFRAIPLVLFLAVLGPILVVARSKNIGRSRLRGAVSLLLVGAFVWSGLTAFNNDFLRAFAYREARADVSTSLARVIEPDSIVFTNATTNFLQALVQNRVRIAVPLRDGYRDFQALRQFHSEQGRNVYVWLDEKMMQGVRDHGLFENSETEEIFEVHGLISLVRLLQPPAPAACCSSGPSYGQA